MVSCICEVFGAFVDDRWGHGFCSGCVDAWGFPTTFPSLSGGGIKSLLSKEGVDPSSMHYYLSFRSSFLLYTVGGVYWLDWPF